MSTEYEQNVPLCMSEQLNNAITGLGRQIETITRGKTTSNADICDSESLALNATVSTKD
jgi:hypothetical protein